MVKPIFPANQGQLLRAARGQKSASQFAAELGVSRSCLSRYERERRGIPPEVLNYCLVEVATALGRSTSATPLDEALEHARQTVHVLETAVGNESAPARRPNKVRTR